MSSDLPKLYLDVLALPVVDGTAGGRVIGIVKRSDVASTYLRHVQGAAEDASSTKPL